MKIFKITAMLLFAALFATTAAFAQGQMGQGQQQMPDVPSSDDVSDTELNQFVTTITQIEPIQIELQADVEELVEEEELAFERFQQLMMAMQNPQMAEQVEMSDEEREKIQSIQPKLSELQMKAEEEIIEKIEENGLNVERYQAIMMGAQQDQELMTRLQQALESAQG
ncbi:DUF4168 domain-containing protein [Rhodohalobacter sp. SW132]|uniref:DUF4168 domain-containing protein n=1 Tax=Rhodohalobacter sp. SW132 TaxID=2293433 RepID=UPI000E21D537|nr:DUF4168 domain-containing protein [Rhodohalobacter sp. SW132]REL38927.1 DUF4168 domain-containing protein [Rhodohalobacter sp. SW132]